VHREQVTSRPDVRRRRDLDLALRAVAALDAEMEGEGFSRVEDGVEAFAEFLAVFGVDAGGPAVAGFVLDGSAAEGEPGALEGTVVEEVRSEKLKVFPSA